MCKGNKGTGSGTSATTLTTTESAEQTTAASAAPTTTHTSGSCTGRPCPDPTQCRSQWGWCGVTEGHCNSQSTWTPACQGGTDVTIGTTVTSTQASGSCTGEPCCDSTHCRSQWGWCGAT